MTAIECQVEQQRIKEWFDRTFAAQVSKSDLRIRHAHDYAEYDWGKFLEEEERDEERD